MDRQNLDKAFHAAELIIKYLRGSPEENESPDLDSWTKESEENRVLFSELTDPAQLKNELLKFYQIDARKQAVLRKISQQMFVY